MSRKLLVLAAALAVLPVRSFASDSDTYQKIAAKLSEKAAPKLTQKKIAILPFDYVDKRKSPGGDIVSEKLIDKFVDYGELSVIERSLMQKMLGELKLQSSGAIDADTAKQLGKGLGAEAIVTGTLEDSENGKTTTINARIIKTDTFEIIGAAQGDVSKTWQDAPPETAGGEERPMPSPKKRSWAPVAKVEDNPTRPTGFFDVFLGVGGSNMTIKFENDVYGVNGCGIGFTIGGSCNYNVNKLEIDSAKTGTSVPLGFRVGGFGQIVGGDFEMSFYQHSITQQTGLSGLANSNTLSNISLSADYMKVSVFNLLTGDLFIRIPVSENFFPYVGFGGGLALANIQSNSVLDVNNALLNETAPALALRVPVGIRFKVADRVALFLEARYVWDYIPFNRTIASETDSITLSGFQGLGGVSFLF